MNIGNGKSQTTRIFSIEECCESISERDIIITEKAPGVTENFVVIPPDGGWGWMVVLGSFFSFMIIDGIICTFGIFLKDMSESFDAKKSHVSLAGAIMTGFFCLSG